MKALPKPRIILTEEDSAAASFISKYCKFYSIMEKSYQTGMKATPGHFESAVNKTLREAEEYYTSAIGEPVKVYFDTNERSLNIEYK